MARMVNLYFLSLGQVNSTETLLVNFPKVIGGNNNSPTEFDFEIPILLNFPSGFLIRTLIFVLFGKSVNRTLVGVNTRV